MIVRGVPTKHARSAAGRRPLYLFTHSTNRRRSTQRGKSDGSRGAGDRRRLPGGGGARPGRSAAVLADRGGGSEQQLGTYGAGRLLRRSGGVRTGAHRQGLARRSLGGAEPP